MSVQIKPSDSFNVFFFFSSSPLIQEPLVQTCTVPESSAQDVKHMLTLTHSVMSTPL